MKFFNKRAATAFMLAVSMLGTCISPAFAEGSREFNEVPEGSNTIVGREANRPYFEWRDRGQFGMPSRNIMYVYAKAGETIYFGSDVVTANDKSIEAVTHSEVSFTQSLNSAGRAWAGSSIAVTLPVSDSEAWDPVGQTDFYNLFVEGSQLETLKDTSKVYLFKPTENGAGHIANPTMEENGPNGVVRKGATTATTDGYEPLSFVAPYTGTYSFRFLAREFSESDRPMAFPKDPTSLNMISIDFQGLDGKLTTGDVSSNVNYYEPDFGTVNLTYHSGKTLINNAVAGTKAPATAYSNEVTYTGDDVYFQTDNSTTGRGSIIFTPLHNNVELEIVWDTTGQNERDIVVVQNGVEERIRVTDGADLTVTRISSIKGNPIVAGLPVTVYAQTISGGTNNGDWRTNYYEIRYYYERVDLPQGTPDPTPSPTPSPTPTPEPTATPVPTPIVLNESKVDFSSLSGMTYDNDGRITNDLYEMVFYNRGGDKRGFTYESAGTLYTNTDNRFYGWDATTGAATDDTAGVIGITPKYENAYVEIDIVNVNGDTLTVAQKTATGTAYTMGSVAGSSSEGTVVSAMLPVGETTYIYFNKQWTRIKEIRYIVADQYPFEAVNESVDWSSIAAGKYNSNEANGDIDTTITDLEMGVFTLYASGEAGYEIVENSSSEDLEGTTYPAGHKRIYLSQKGTLNTSDLANSTGSVVAFTPNHDGASIEIVWKTDSRDSNVNLNINDGSERVLDTIAKNQAASSTAKVEGLKKGEPIYLWFDTWNAMIYEIRYSYPGTEMASEFVDFSTIETHAADGIDTTVSDAVIGDFTLYSNSTAGYVAANLGAASLVVGDKTYYSGHKRVSLPDFNQSAVYAEDGNHAENSGGVMSLTPKHDGAYIDIYWIVDKKTQGTVNLKKNNVNFDSVDARAGAAAKVTRIKDLKQGEPVYISFDADYAQIYEIVYNYPAAAATGETGEVMSLFSADGVADAAYAEWTLTETYQNANEEKGTVENLAGTDGYLPDGTTAATVMNGPTTSDGLAAAPALYYSRTPAAERANASSSYRGDAAAITTYNGTPITASKGFKSSGDGKYGYTFIVDPKLAENNAESYDMIIAFWSNAGYSEENPTADLTSTLKLVELDTAAFGQVASGPDVAMSASSSDLVQYEVKGLTKYASFGFNAQPGLAYVGIKYNTPEPTPEPTEAPTPAPAVVNPKPVSFAYTWDFYHMNGGKSFTTDYTTDQLIGTLDLIDGVDYDHSYVYDLKVHATAEKPVTVNQESLYMYHNGVFGADGTPESGVLEMIPAWNGTVEVVFSAGTVEIKQADGTPVSAASENNALTKVVLNVEKNKPVYIYSTSASWIKAVKYVPETPSYTGFSERRVDDQWVTAPALVAAWDITVASPETEDETGTTTRWKIYDEFKTPSKGENSSSDGVLKLYYGSDTAPDTETTITYENAQVNGVKINGIKDDNESNVFKFTPKSDGEVTLYAWQDGVSRIATIAQGNSSASMTFDITKTMKTVSLDVVAGEEVLIYGNAGIYYHKIEFTPHTKVATGVWNENTGRVWTDILFLNAGNFQSSIYPEFNVLTKDGFLYDVRLNGIQPWSFAFYSNNRGFLFDPWSLYTNPENSLGAGAAKQYDRLQALEHSFYSYSSASDVGPAPVRIEKDANNNPILYNGNIMQSSINGNYIPVDGERDSTHKIFFNSPDTDSLKVYTDPGELKIVTDDPSVYAELLQDIVYEGLGNVADNTGEVHYGTEGIGGRFMLKVTAEEAIKLKGLGSNSVSILLDFSKYELDETATPVANVPVLNSNGTWKLRDESVEASEYEANNMVSLSAVIDTSAEATEDNVVKTYIISWDGRDAYGNVVPQGEYSDGVKSFIEMGMAHFPILDAEHNPNGIKIRMENEGNKYPDHIFYNNEAISPRNNPEDPSAWYYTSRSNNADYPNQIGDGKNMTAGVSTAFDNAGAPGGMVFGHYTGGETGQSGTDGGYGNFAGLDIWSKYEVEANAEIKIGVKAIENLKSYVSFVATDGTVEGATDADLPFKVSHVGYAQQKLEEYPKNIGSAVDGDKFGNTISTGFVAKLSNTNENATDSYVTWDISVPVTGRIESTDGDGKETLGAFTPTFIKVPDSDKEAFTTQEDIDEADYLAYELYAGLFEDYAMDSSDEEISIGEEFVPDWEADASLDADMEPGIMDTPDGAENAELGLTEEMYIEAMSLSGEAGDYKNGNWSIAFNVSETPTLTDEPDVQVNKGDIYKVENIGGDTEYKANIRLKYKLPTEITGMGTVTVGLVIDNLYSPAATAKAGYSNSDLQEFHDITSTLFNAAAYVGTNSASVQASTYGDYATSQNNPYYNKALDPKPAATSEPTVAPTATPTAEPEESPEPTTAPTAEPTIIPIAESKTWTFDSFSSLATGDYTVSQLLGDTLMVHAGDSASSLHVTVGSNGQDFNEDTVIDYSKYVDVKGSGKFASGVPTGRVIEFVPAVTGKVRVAVRNTSSTDERILIIEQNGVKNELQLGVESNSFAEITGVTENSPVYIYSKSSGLRIYSVEFIAD